MARACSLLKWRLPRVAYRSCRRRTDHTAGPRTPEAQHMPGREVRARFPTPWLIADPDVCRIALKTVDSVESSEPEMSPWRSVRNQLTVAPTRTPSSLQPPTWRITGERQPGPMCGQKLDLTPLRWLRFAIRLL